MNEVGYLFVLIDSFRLCNVCLLKRESRNTNIIAVIEDISIVSSNHTILHGTHRSMRANLIEHTDNQRIATHRLFQLLITTDSKERRLLTSSSSYTPSCDGS